MNSRLPGDDLFCDQSVMAKQYDAVDNRMSYLPIEKRKIDFSCYSRLAQTNITWKPHKYKSMDNTPNCVRLI